MGDPPTSAEATVAHRPEVAPIDNLSPDDLWRRTSDAVLDLGARLIGGQLVLDENSSADDTADGSMLVRSLEGEPVGRLQAPNGDEAAQVRAIADALAAAASTRAAVGSFDAMTMLPNRKAFLADMAHRPAGTGEGLLVLATIADARQYNELLRALGHAYAEDFIAVAAQRIRAVIPPEYRLYHVSVLSFAFVLAGEDGNTTPAIVHEIVAAMRDPIDCQAIPITSRVGVGMSPLPPNPVPVAESLRAALTAAQDSRGKNAQHAFYDRRADEAHQRAFTLLTDLRTAIDRGDQLHLAFQPRISLRTGRSIGAEALLRWRHPVYGDVPPGEFVPLAEATALVGPLTTWVLEAAMRHAAIWRRHVPDLRISVNVSPANLSEHGFAERLTDGVGRHGLTAEAIELEITEGAATSGDGDTLRQLHRLRDLGHTLAIDDFGTGYSNLVYLTQLPTSVLKIDQSFVRPLESDPRRQLMVRSIIEMAHGLGYTVVAEGIETREAYDMLAAWRCDEGQGFLMSRPLPAAAFERFLAA